MTFLLYAVIVLLSLLSLVVAFILVVYLIDLLRGIFYDNRR